MSGLPSLRELLQGLAIEVFHGDEAAIPVRSDLDRLDDVRVVQARRQAGLIHEHRGPGLCVEKLSA
jgi:hypothetical protein